MQCAPGVEGGRRYSENGIHREVMEESLGWIGWRNRQCVKELFWGRGSWRNVRVVRLDLSICPSCFRDGGASGECGGVGRSIDCLGGESLNPLPLTRPC